MGKFELKMEDVEDGAKFEKKIKDEYGTDRVSL